MASAAADAPPAAAALGQLGTPRGAAAAPAAAAPLARGASLARPAAQPGGADAAKAADMYISELLSYSLERLRKEPELLAEERARVERGVASAALAHYHAFIDSAAALGVVQAQLGGACDGLGALAARVPDLAGTFEGFSRDAAGVLAAHAANKQLLAQQATVLELLDAPQLMDTCVRNGVYDEALDLHAFISRVALLHPDLPVVRLLAAQAQAVSQAMLGQLLARLRTNIQLPECLRVIGYLRRMAAFPEAELRLHFLRCREDWLSALIGELDDSDSYEFAKQLTDVHRLHLFDVVMQYRAIFFDAAPAQQPDGGGGGVREGGVLFTWVQHRVVRYVSALTAALPGVEEGTNLASVLEHATYACSSLARVGLDFSGLLAPLFQLAALRLFSAKLGVAVDAFHARLDAHKWVAMPSPMFSKAREAQQAQPDGGGDGAGGAGGGAAGAELAPPYALMEHVPLAVFTNGALSALNELRHCALLPLQRPAAALLQGALEQVAGALVHYRHTRALAEGEVPLFAAACRAHADVVATHLAACFAAVFPGAALAAGGPLSPAAVAAILRDAAPAGLASPALTVQSGGSGSALGPKAAAGARGAATAAAAAAQQQHAAAAAAAQQHHQQHELLAAELQRQGSMRAMAAQQQQQQQQQQAAALGMEHAMSLPASWGSTTTAHHLLAASLAPLGTHQAGQHHALLGMGAPGGLLGAAPMQLEAYALGAAAAAADAYAHSAAAAAAGDAYACAPTHSAGAAAAAAAAPRPAGSNSPSSSSGGQHGDDYGHDDAHRPRKALNKGALAQKRFRERQKQRMRANEAQVAELSSQLSALRVDKARLESRARLLEQVVSLNLTHEARLHTNREIMVREQEMLLGELAEFVLLLDEAATVAAAAAPGTSAGAPGGLLALLLGAAGQQQQPQQEQPQQPQPQPQQQQEQPPQQQQQRQWCEQLARLPELTSALRGWTVATMTDTIFPRYIACLQALLAAGGADAEAAVSRLVLRRREMTDRHALFSHYYWAVWCLNQGEMASAALAPPPPADWRGVLAALRLSGEQLAAMAAARRSLLAELTRVADEWQKVLPTLALQLLQVPRARWHTVAAVQGMVGNLSAEREAVVAFLHTVVDEVLTPQQEGQLEAASYPWCPDVWALTAHAAAAAAAAAAGGDGAGGGGGSGGGARGAKARREQAKRDASAAAAAAAAASAAAAEEDADPLAALAVGSEELQPLMPFMTAFQLLRCAVTARGAGLRLKRALLLDPFRTVVPAAAFPQPAAPDVAAMSLLDAHCGAFQTVMLWDWLKTNLPGRYTR
ncbi:COG8 [Scenedesmus sp. PABB004]|nr:COG8 [Scenedesmus sp. PABB004]